jgi:hypothetical protein
MIALLSGTSLSVTGHRVSTPGIFWHASRKTVMTVTHFFPKKPLYPLVNQTGLL